MTALPSPPARAPRLPRLRPDTFAPLRCRAFHAKTISKSRFANPSLLPTTPYPMFSFHSLHFSLAFPPVFPSHSFFFQLLSLPSFTVCFPKSSLRYCSVLIPRFSFSSVVSISPPFFDVLMVNKSINSPEDIQHPVYPTLSMRKATRTRKKKNNDKA